MRPADAIIGPARGDSGIARSWAAAQGASRLPDVRTYIQEVYRLAPLVGIDPAIVVAQSAHETANWTSPPWVNWLNPAGLGITKKGEDPGYRWQTGTDAARAQIAHLYAYVYGNDGSSWPDDLAQPSTYDPRWQDAIDLVFSPKPPNPPLLVRTINDLTGKWGVDPNYAVGVVARGNQIFPSLPDQKGTSKVSRGHVPEPPMMTAYQARINAIGGKNCTDGIARTIVGSNHHTEVGKFTGTWQWFLNPNNGALTDFQIGGKWDGQYNGVIMRFIEPDMPVAPYANGVIGEARPPFGDGLRFVQTFGYGEAINAKLRSVEWSDDGQPNRMDYQLTDPQVESDCFVTAYIHSEEAGQSWEEFDWYLFHSESGTSHEGCPGPWRWTNVDALRARVVEIMKGYQTDTPLSRPLLITYPPGWTGGTIHQPGHGQGVPVEVPPPAPKPKPEPWVFDPKLVWPNVGDGAVSKLYLKWSAEHESWGKPDQPWNDSDGKGGKLFRFDNGLIIRLYKGKAEVVKGTATK